MFRADSPWAKDRGAEVRRRRIAAGLTTHQLADLCGVSAPAIYRVEAGQFIASDRLRAVIAYHLGVRPETLWKFPSHDALVEAAS